MSHKYNASPTTRAGRKFDSKLEANRWQDLELLERAGQISDLEFKPVYELQPAFRDRDGKKWKAITYVADASYVEAEQEIVEDVKGVETAVFKIKRKMFLYRYPELVLRIVK